MFDLERWPECFVRQFECEAAMHHLAPGRIMADGQAGDIEGQVKPDDRSPAFITVGEENFINKRGDGPDRKTVRLGIILQRINFIFRQRFLVVENPGLLEVITFSELENAEADLLGGIGIGLGVKDQRIV